MHILVNGWFWGNDSSGSGQYLHYLAEEFSQLFATECERFTLVVPKKQASPNEALLPKNVHLVQQSPSPLPRQLSKVWWEQITMPRLAKRMAADVLWIPYWAAPWWQPVATVTTIHDIIPLLLPPYRGGRLQRIYTSLVSSSARRSTAIITVSNSSKRDIVQHLQINDAKVHSILSGVNRFAVTNKYQSHSKSNVQDYASALSTQELQAKYKLPPRFFLYLGGFDMRKNVQSVIQAYHAYLEKQGTSDVMLVVAGKLPNGEGDFFPDPKKQADRLGISKFVHFCGFVDEADKKLLYQHAVGYFFPSLYEGFGMTVLEAMDAGVPTVTSKAS